MEREMRRSRDKSRYLVATGVPNEKRTCQSASIAFADTSIGETPTKKKGEGPESTVEQLSFVKGRGRKGKKER